MKTGARTAPPPLDKVVIYTDGSSSIKDRSGGWAFSAKWEGVTAVKYGYESPATNITMELTAILRAMEFVRPAPQRQLVIHTDSEYSIKAVEVWSPTWIRSNWRNSQGREVANRALLERVLLVRDLHIAKGCSVKLHWVRGHSGVAGNEEVDALAGKARVGKLTNWKVSDTKSVFIRGD